MGAGPQWRRSARSRGDPQARPRQDEAGDARLGHPRPARPAAGCGSPRCRRVLRLHLYCKAGRSWRSPAFRPAPPAGAAGAALPLTLSHRGSAPAQGHSCEPYRGWLPRPHR